MSCERGVTEDMCMMSSSVDAQYVPGFVYACGSTLQHRTSSLASPCMLYHGASAQWEDISWMNCLSPTFMP